MKKILYTLSFLTMLSFAGNAQSDKSAAKHETAKHEKASTTAVAVPATAANEDHVPTPVNGATKLTVSQKATPASNGSKDKPKEEKANKAAQPAATDKK